MGAMLTSVLYKYGFDDDDIEDLEVPVRYKPESLSHLCETTLFTKHELQLMYRGFKQSCPSGAICVEKFKEILSRFFVQGNSQKYAQFMFTAFDHNLNGLITFEELVIGLSVLSRGTLVDKLDWLFSLYDINHRNAIEYSELYAVVSSIYDLMGDADPPVDEDVVKNHVAEIFRRMDPAHSGIITKQNFISTCQNDVIMRESLVLFDCMSCGPTSNAQCSTIN